MIPEKLMEKAMKQLEKLDPEELLRSMLPIKKTVTVTTLKDGRIAVIIGDVPTKERTDTNTKASPKT